MSRARWQIPVIQLLGRLRPEICLNPGGEVVVNQGHTIALQPGQQEQNCLKNKNKSQVQWHMPVISALWEAEAGRSQGQEFETSLVNKVKPRLYQKYKKN